MIINIKNNKDLITIDLRTKQIRYLNDFENRGLIQFIDLSNSDTESYEYLFNLEEEQLFNQYNILKETLKEDIKSFLNKDIKIKDLEVLKILTDSEY
jgi:hypothetical protein